MRLLSHGSLALTLSAASLRTTAATLRPLSTNTLSAGPGSFSLTVGRSAGSPPGVMQP